MEKIHSKVISLIQDDENIFISGQGGTGKSTLIEYIKDYFIYNEIPFAITASTGISALNIGGSTIHSWAGLGNGDTATHSIINNKKIRQKWTKTRYLIIDEISMIGKKIFDKLDAIGKGITKCILPFGGLHLIVVGDLMQLPPIKDEYFFHSAVYDKCNFKYIKLTHPYRFMNSEGKIDETFFNLLSNVRIGSPTKEDINLLKSCVSKYRNAVQPIEKNGIKPTILYSKKVNVDELNNAELDKLETKNYEYVAKDTFEKGVDIAKARALLDQRIAQQINLKVGAQVMNIINYKDIDIKNGSRGVVCKLTEEYAVVRFVNLNNKYRIYRTPISITDSGDIIAVRNQIPLILAYAMTIHKSQSCTLDFVVTDLGRNNIWCNSMAYVALSRCRNLDGLYIETFSKNIFNENIEVIKFENEVMNIEEIEEIEEGVVGPEENKDED